MENKQFSAISGAPPPGGDTIGLGYGGLITAKSSVTVQRTNSGLRLFSWEEPVVHPLKE
jgi:hypothetical protein